MRHFITVIFLLSVYTLFGNSAENQDTLLVGYTESPPFVTDESNDMFGVSVWLWENIVQENKLVYKYKKFTIDSLVYALENNKVDIAISPLTITSKRSEVIGFSSPFYIANSSIMIRQLSGLQKAWQFITSFISINFLRAVGALIIVILFFGALLWFFEKDENHEEFGPGIHGIWDSFWWSAVTMTTVGYGDKSPRSVGGRIVALIWMFTAIIIISGFTASIASSLTINQIDSSASSFEDFKDRSIGTIRNSATNHWLHNYFFQDIHEYSDFDEMLKALKTKEIDAIAYDRPMLHNIVTRNSESFDLVNVTFNPQFYAFGFSKQLDKELVKAINISMLQNIEKMEWQIMINEHGLD